MSKTKLLGETIYPGGRYIEISAPHQEWLDYGVNAIAQYDRLKADRDALLETLKECLVFWDQPPNGPGGNTLRKVWLDKLKRNARAAIAQVEKDPKP